MWAGVSAAEAAAAVDHDALAGDEPGAFGGQEADGVGDVARSSHPPGGHRGEIGLLDLVRDVGVALDGMNSGATVFTVMPDGPISRAQLVT
jgi:hypothetical protein